jgi:hypothetical protein
MPLMIRLMLWPVLAGLMACNPTFNWRDARVQDTGLTGLLPCKPDQTVRPVAMGGSSLDLHMLGCETGAALFVIAHVDTRPVGAASVSTPAAISPPTSPPTSPPISPPRSPEIAGKASGAVPAAVALPDMRSALTGPPTERNALLLAQWREANLAALRASSSSTAPLTVRGADAVPPAQKTTATGLRPDNRRIESQSVYFARGDLLFYAVILADRIADDVAEAFFSGLKLE